MSIQDLSACFWFFIFPDKRLNELSPAFVTIMTDNILYLQVG